MNKFAPIGSVALLLITVISPASASYRPSVVAQDKSERRHVDGGVLDAAKPKERHAICKRFNVLKPI